MIDCNDQTTSLKWEDQKPTTKTTQRNECEKSPRWLWRSQTIIIKIDSEIVKFYSNGTWNSIFLKYTMQFTAEKSIQQSLKMEYTVWGLIVMKCVRSRPCTYSRWTHCIHGLNGKQQILALLLRLFYLKKVRVYISHNERTATTTPTEFTQKKN